MTLQRPLPNNMVCFTSLRNHGITFIFVQKSMVAKIMQAYALSIQLFKIVVNTFRLFI